MSIDIKSIADALGVSKRGCELRAMRETWAFEEVSVRGGKKRMYALASLPKVIRDSILTHKVNNLPPAGVSTISPASSAGPTSPAPFYSVATLDIDRTTTRQREEKLARQAILRRLDELQRASGSSREVAMNTMLTMARAGTLGDALCETLKMARDPRGAKGDLYPKIRTLKRWIAKDKADDLMPKQVQSVVRIQPWHAVAIQLRKRPQGTSMKWLHDTLVEQWNTAWGDAPSYHMVRRFFTDKYSQIDQLKGRFSGSQLRAHKFYQHRTSEGLAPADEIHADGWNTHFTAPHPVTGEFVTYEVWHFHDVATRYVTQPGIALTENADVIAKGLENCIRELGVMVHLQTDSTGVVKGNDKFTTALHSLEARLGFTWVHPKEVGNSQANGIAENFNTSWLDKCSRELATYQNKNSMDSLSFKRVKKITGDMVKAANAGDLVLRDQKKKEAERMGKGLVFTSYAEAVDWIRSKITKYNDRPHRGLKKIRGEDGKMRHQTPREALQEHISNGWQMTQLDEQELIDAFRPHVKVKVTRETVTPYGGMRYRNPDVLGHWNGKEVVVAYDMDDFNEVVVKDLNGAEICKAEFVGATGYRGQTAREAGEERRTLATLKRIDKKRDTVLARNPGVVIEAPSNVKTIADFIDITPVIPKERERTIADFLPEAKQEDKPASYQDTLMWLRGEGADPRSKEVAASK